MQTSEMQKTFEKIFSVCEIIEFKLVALNIHFYGEREREKEKETGRQTDRETDKETDREREYLSLEVNMLTNSLKISDTTKTAFFELKFFQSDQTI